MLTGFFKNPADKDCICKIVEYEDRIWLDDKGDASIYRCFIVEVDNTSPHQLSEIIMLIPYQHLLNPKDKSETCFDNKFHLNDTGNNGRYKIKKRPETLNIPSAASLGLIDDDGFENIKVFVGSIIKTSPYFNLTLLTYEFPIPLTPGDLCEIRISFSITSLFENTALTGKNPSFEFITQYFESKMHDDALKRIDLNTEIPVISTLGAPRGGFDIMVYFPSTLKIGRCYPHDADIK